MRVEIRQSFDENTTEVRQLIERRTGFALGRFGPRVLSVRWFLKDTNGPRGGMDLQCKAVAKVTGLGEVVVEDRDCRLEQLIDRVAERIGVTVARRLERKRFGDARIAFDGNTSP